MKSNDKIIITMTCTIWCLRVTVNILNNYEIHGPNEKNDLKLKKKKNGEQTASTLNTKNETH